MLCHSVWKVGWSRLLAVGALGLVASAPAAIADTHARGHRDGARGGERAEVVHVTVQNHSQNELSYHDRAGRDSCGKGSRGRDHDRGRGAGRGCDRGHDRGRDACRPRRERGCESNRRDSGIRIEIRGGRVVVSGSTGSSCR